MEKKEIKFTTIFDKKPVIYKGVFEIYHEEDWHESLDEYESMLYGYKRRALSKRGGRRHNFPEHLSEPIICKIFNCARKTNTGRFIQKPKDVKIAFDLITLDYDNIRLIESKAKASVGPPSFSNKGMDIVVAADYSKLNGNLDIKITSWRDLSSCNVNVDETFEDQQKDSRRPRNEKCFEPLETVLTVNIYDKPFHTGNICELSKIKSIKEENIQTCLSF
jgi:hypothetical protein